MHRLILVACTALGLLLSTAGPVSAQSAAPAPEPAAAAPLRLVVPLPPGGPSDFIARQVAQHLSGTLGQPVRVDNRPGANGLIAARDVAAAPADGQTLLYAPGSMLAAPLLARDERFDWARQLAPLGTVAAVPFALAVHGGVPATTVAELLAHARSRPGSLDVATSTPSEVLAASQFMKATGLRLTRIPYRGAPQALPDLVAGRVQLMFGPVSALQPQARSGAVRLLAVLAPARLSALPDVPTLAEAGVTGVEVPTWQALYVPAGVPAERQRRLAQAVAAAAEDRGLRAELDKRLLAPEAVGPETLGRSLPAQQRQWAALIEEYQLAAE